MKHARIRIILAFLGFALIGVNSGALGVVLPNMATYYGVDKSTISLIFLTSSVGYFFSAFTSSLILERLGLRNFLALGLLAFLLGTLTVSIKPPFLILLATRFFMGFGMAFVETGLNAYVVGLPRHTTVMNSLHAFYGAGAFFGPFVAAFLLSLNWQWSSVYVLWTLLSVPLLFGVLLAFEAHLAIASPGPRQQEDRQENALLAILKLPMVWLAAIFLLLYVGVEVSMGNWGYSFLVENLHQQTFFASAVVSGYWLGFTLGRFTLSALAERIHLSSVGLVYICIISLLFGLLVVWFLPFGLFPALGFCFIGLSLGPIYPTTVALMPSIVSNRTVASAIGFLVSLSILGIAIFPWFAGLLAQTVGIWSLLPYMALLAVLMLLFWWVTFRKSEKKPEEELVRA